MKKFNTRNLVNFLLFCSLISTKTLAQNDSLTILNATWKSTEISSGIKWKSIHFKEKELFNSNQSINILESDLKNKELRFGLAVSDFMKTDTATQRELIITSEMARSNVAIAAVNGGFFDMKKGGAVDFVKIGKTITDTTRISGVARLPFHSISAITIHKNRVKIIKGSQKLGWEKEIKDENVLLTGPLLIFENQKQELAKTAFNENRHPRTCACITNDEKLLLITVDGRTNQAYGMSLNELTFLSKMLKCKEAINFDGGGSTTMWIDGQPENGVVNYPCDNKLFDHAGERKVANIFMITKK